MSCKLGEQDTSRSSSRDWQGLVAEVRLEGVELAAASAQCSDHDVALHRRFGTRYSVLCEPLIKINATICFCP